MLSRFSISRTRIVYTGRMNSDGTLRIHTKTEDWPAVWTGVGGTHSTFKLIDAENNRDLHPDWFARKEKINGETEYYNQVCFSSQGMYEKLLSGVIDQLDRYPDRPNVMVGIEDNRDYCQCLKCRELLAKYNNCASASMIICVNKIAREIKNRYPNRNIKVVVFAYYAYLDAPVKKENGEYKPIDNEIICEDNVGVMLAPIDSDYSHSYYEEGYNTAEREAFEGWSKLAKSLYVWTYTTNFSNFLIPFDSFSTMQDNIRYFSEHNVEYVFAQGQYGNINATGFVALQTFLQQKLLWDAGQNYNQLIDKFFEHYFYDAAPYMRKLFNELRLHYAMLLETNGVNSTIYNDVVKSSYWPQNLLISWERYVDEALNAVKKYESTSPSLYKKLVKRIKIESIAIRYLRAELHKSGFAEREYQNYLEQLKKDILELQIGYYNENDPVEKLFSVWGV